MIIIIIELKGAGRDLSQSPHCAANCLQHVRSSDPGEMVYKSRAAHRALITCKVVYLAPLVYLLVGCLALSWRSKCIWVTFHVSTSLICHLLPVAQSIQKSTTKSVFRWYWFERDVLLLLLLLLVFCFVLFWFCCCCFWFFVWKV